MIYAIVEENNDEDTNNKYCNNSNSTLSLGLLLTRSTCNSTSSSSSSSSSMDTAASIDEGLSIFIDFMKPITAHLFGEGKCYTYQINSNQTLLHKDIETLSQLLVFSDNETTAAEDETKQVLLSIGLYKNNCLGPSLNIKNWETIKKIIVGFKLHKQFGDKRQNLFTVGHDMSFDSIDTMRHQVKNNFKPPSIPCTVPNTARYYNIDIPTPTMTTAVTVTVTATATSSTMVTNNNNNGDRLIEFMFDDDDIERNNQSKGKHKKYEIKRRVNLDAGSYSVSSIRSWYKVVHKQTLNTYKKSPKKMEEIRKVQKRKNMELWEINAVIVGSLAARYLQALDVILEQVLAIGGAILSSEFGLSDYSKEGGELGIDDISIIEPKRTTISYHVQKTVAYRIILNIDRMLKSKAVFLATDHGGGVLIKMAFFYDSMEKRVIKLNLDFDKSGHNAADSGIAIAHSMKKYTFREEDIIEFRGGLSDSGGGFTNTVMKNSLIEQVLVDTTFYMHIPCTVHNDQTNLRVAIENNYGENCLLQQNVGQTLHAYAYIQKNIESPDELQALLKSEWAHVRRTPCPADFLKLMQEPILTQ